MTIAGLQKMTLLDYPGKVACTVFLQGCNFRCPFCHNADLLDIQPQQTLDTAAFLDFLGKRVGLLDAVCVSGGEPTLQKDLDILLTGIKRLGLLVKLDTNGSRPEVLKRLVADGLVDYVAMDVKNSPSRYPETTGNPNILLSPIAQSLQYLIEGNVPYELRTTVVAQLHDAQNILEMGQWLNRISSGKKISRFYLQPFVNRDSVLDQHLHAPDSAQIQQYLELLRPFVLEIAVRG